MDVDTAQTAQTHDHITPVGTFLTVYGTLIVLTILTVAVSYMNLSPTPSILVAMGIAALKGSLVVLFFMHLKYDTRFNKLVFITGLWVVTLFFCFTMIDLASRGDVLKVEDNHEKPMQILPPAARGSAPAGENGGHGGE